MKPSAPVFALLVACLIAAGGTTTGQLPGDRSVLTRTVAAAHTFLEQLRPEQRAKAVYPFDSPQKKNWSNLPSGIFQRNSLKLGDMTASQRTAALGLMRAVLSRDGYRKVTEIMNGDEVLNSRGGGRT